MRAFKWRGLLEEQRVPHIDRGPNVKRGELNIRCPFCGSADPSFHMGLNLETGYWACWRNNNHRGKSPLRLIMALLQVPYWKAREVAGLSADFVDPEGFTAIAARILGRDGLMTSEKAPPARFLDLPRDFEYIEQSGPGYRHFSYLRDARGFGTFTGQVARRYELCCGGDVWRDRVIFPYFLDGHLVTWTGRSINGHPIRYRDLEVNESLVAPKHTLYNHDVILQPALALVVVEGPMDTLKLDLFGKAYGVRAVGLSTNSMTDDQLFILTEVAEQFHRVIFMMDNASALGIVDTMRMRAQVSHIKNSTITPVPFGKKDAGELKPAEVCSWAQDLEDTLS